MAVTPASIKVRYPEFASDDDVRIQAAIDEAAIQVSPSFFNAAADLALTYLSAHIWSKSKSSELDGGLTGMSNISEMKLGQSSISFESAIIEASAENEYLATPYGKDYYTLLRRFSGISGV